MKDALRVVTMLSAAMVCVAVSGCRIEANKGKEGKDVDFATPLGGMSIKTNKAASTKGLGMTEYPGSVALEGKNDDDDDKANVDMHFGDFHLKIQTAKFSTKDSQETVLNFYRNDLAQYGTVIECQHDRPISTPAMTGQGLTCDEKDKDKHSSVHTSGSSHGDGLELKAGSKRRQHIAAVEEKNGRTEITLVSLDLPAENKSDKD